MPNCNCPPSFLAPDQLLRVKRRRFQPLHHRIPLSRLVRTAHWDRSIKTNALMFVRARMVPRPSALKLAKTTVAIRNNALKFANQEAQQRPQVVSKRVALSSCAVTESAWRRATLTNASCSVTTKGTKTAYMPVPDASMLSNAPAFAQDRLLLPAAMICAAQDRHPRVPRPLLHSPIL